MPLMTLAAATIAQPFVLSVAAKPPLAFVTGLLHVRTRVRVPSVLPVLAQVFVAFGTQEPHSDHRVHAASDIIGDFFIFPITCETSAKLRLECDLF
jgi:hypothetical protein